MPRKRRAARDRSLSLPSRPSSSQAPEWALEPGVDVRRVESEKIYRCPGCEQVIRPGTSHLVVVPREDPSLRRHWHTECWRRDLRRRRGR